MLSLRIAANQEFDLPEGRFRYVQELSGGRALFVRDEGRAELILDEGEIEERIAASEFRRRIVKRVRGGGPSPYDGSPEVEPDGPADAKARTRAFYVRAWDEAPTSKSEKALRAFIDRKSPLARARGHEWVPSPGSLRRAINERGEPGARTTAVMQSRAGRGGKHSRFKPITVELIERAVAFYYADRPRNVTDAYAWLRRMLVLIERLAPAKYPGWRALPVPTFETLRARIRGAERYETWASKYGERQARQRFRGVQEGLSADRILEKAVIDSTPDNVWIYDHERSLPLGRPTLTVCIDVHSRMILALIVTFEPMSLHTIMSALIETNTPKVDWARTNPDCRAVDAWGCPETVYVDNAWEQVGVSFQDAAADGGMSVEWAPIANPEYKALVERVIKTLQDATANKFRGGVPLPASLMRKFELDPSEDACVSLADYTRALRMFVAETYQMEPHGTLGMAPARAWEESKRKHGRRFIRDLPLLRASSGVYKSGVLTREGVRHNNLRFHDPDKVSLLLDQLASSTPIRRRRVGSATAAIKFKLQPADCGSVNVWNDVTGKYVELPCIERRYLGTERLSWATHDAVQRYAKAENLNFFSDEEKWTARNRLRVEIESNIGDAKFAVVRKQRRILHPPEPVAPIGGFVVAGDPRPSAFGTGPFDIEVSPAAATRRDGGMPERDPPRGGSRKRRPALARPVPVPALPPPATEPTDAEVTEPGTGIGDGPALFRDVDVVSMSWIHGVRSDDDD